MDHHKLWKILKQMEMPGHLTCLLRNLIKDFILLDSKITVDGDCSHEIKRHLLLGRKAMTKLDSVLKSRDITLSTKVRIVKLQFFQQSCMVMRVGP